jgi:hypothetical protein
VKNLLIIPVIQKKFPEILTILSLTTYRIFHETFIIIPENFIEFFESFIRHPCYLKAHFCELTATHNKGH